MRALVVEDEAALREGLREQLVKQGFTVDVAADGEEGLFAGSEYPLDIAVVDLGLPKVSGLELIRKLRGSGAPPVVRSRFAFLTGWDAAAPVASVTRCV